MCGLNGIIKIGEVNQESLLQELTEMNDLIVHRGPDDSGTYFKNLENVSFCMGMRRLSIIDLNSGSQPIFNDDKSIVIVFNGEIYNYKVLKSELEKEGVLFNTNSDTEVILKLYEKKGVDCFNMLDGMFAFSIYDKNKNKIFIARDFFGEKPLYYTKNEGSFYWASELKSIVNSLKFTPEISKKALSLYFQLTYIPAPNTIYENIYKLESNHYIEFDCIDFEFEIKKTKEKDQIKYGKLSFEEAKKITKKLIFDSVESRSISDVPIGTFLSGGVDSSIVSHCLSEIKNQPIDTFSIGFDKKKFDETDKAQLVAKGIKSNHHQFRVKVSDIKNDVNEVLLNFDEPFADSSALPTFLVSKLTRANVKVALTGDGGDEVFGGYNKYYIGKLNTKYTNLVSEGVHKNFIRYSDKILQTKDDSRGLRFKMKRLFKAINYNNEFYYNIISLGFQKNELKDLFVNCSNNDDFMHYKEKEIKSLKDFRNLDKSISLEGDMLVKVDRTSMLASLECRAPFLNKELWNFTNQLPDNYLIKGWNKKHLLKESFKQYFPNKFLEKSKKGFEIPVGDWLRNSFKKELLCYVETDYLIKQNIFNINFMQKLINDHVDGLKDNTFRVWTFYCFQKWYNASIL
jgi:asparagine synthase (glutamine-hydrolysing)